MPVDFDKQEKAVQSALKSAAKGSGSKILKRVAKQQKVDESKMRMLHMLFSEMLDMIRGGEMKFSAAVDDFAEAAKSLEKSA